MNLPPDVQQRDDESYRGDTIARTVAANLLFDSFKDIMKAGFAGLTKTEKKIVGSEENFGWLMYWIGASR